jgi:hypothetical protein
MENELTLGNDKYFLKEILTPIILDIINNCGENLEMEYPIVELNPINFLPEIKHEFRRVPYTEIINLKYVEISNRVFNNQLRIKKG